MLVVRRVILFVVHWLVALILSQIVVALIAAQMQINAVAQTALSFVVLIVAQMRQQAHVELRAAQIAVCLVKRVFQECAHSLPNEGKFQASPHV